METREYRTADKSGWDRGPWDDEPDKRQWPDAATGYPCLIVRNEAGALCGYVGVTEDHPLFGKKGFDLPLDCHGGITFSAPCNPAEPLEHGICHLPGPGEPDHVWWFGFDASHYDDLSPGMDAQLRSLMPDRTSRGHYRDIAYISAQVAGLAAQLRALA